jgi:hypothetical protein
MVGYAAMVLWYPRNLVAILLFEEVLKVSYDAMKSGRDCRTVGSIVSGLNSSRGELSVIPRRGNAVFLEIRGVVICLSKKV